jgi:carnitine-CoA ligase
MPLLPNQVNGREVDIVGLLDHQATRYPDRTFIHTPSEVASYCQVHARSRRLAGALAELGVGHGTTVAVLMENSVEQVVVWFALARLGAVHAPLNTALFGPGLRHALTVLDSRVLIADDRLYPRVTDLPGESVGFETVVLHRTADPITVDGALQLAGLIASGRPVEPTGGDPLDPATILFTSGTTGVSKACVLSRRYLAAQGAAHADNLRLDASDVLYSPFPLFHIDAATLTVIAALSVGATAALSRRFSASRFWGEVRASRATAFNFMGATLTILWKQPPSEQDRRHRVRLAWGVPMPEWKQEWESRFGFPLYQVYGSTDAGVPVYDPVDGRQRGGTCGRVTGLYEVRIAPASSRAGEILVRGRHPGLTMSGYFAMPQATARTIDADGWIHTGDLGSLDADGYLAFRGRLTDSIRRRGENISAYEVEQVVLSHPGVLEAAAIGLPSELTEEDVKVCVVLRAGADLQPRDLYEYMLEHAPKHMVPRYYEIVPALPKTPTQKVEKFQLRSAGINPATWDADAFAGRVIRRHPGKAPK